MKYVPSIIQRNQAGFALMQIMVVMSVMVLMTSGIVIMLNSLNKEQNTISTKIEYSAGMAIIKDMFQRNADCNCQIVGKVINANAANTEYTLSSIRTSCAVNAQTTDLMTTNLISNSDALKVSRIRVSNIVSTGYANEFTGDLMVTPHVNNQMRIFNTGAVNFRFHTDPASPVNAKIIRGCGYVPLPQPSGLTATGGLGEGVCTFNWTPTVGRPTISYTVTGSTSQGQTLANKGDKFCSSNDGSTTCSINGLTPDVPHYFVMSASNLLQGTSPNSSMITCIPARLPGAPVLTAVGADRSCTLTWPTPALGTNPKTYTIYRDSSPAVSKASTAHCVGTSANSCVVNGLTNGVTYYFKATSTNSAGESPLSNAISCLPADMCRGNVQVTLVFPGGCRKGRRTNNYTLTLRDVESRPGGSRYFVRGNINVRKHHPCATVYCPVSFTCSGATVVPSSTNLSCPRTPLAGTLVNTYPNQWTAAGDSSHGWTNVGLWVRP